MHPLMIWYLNHRTEIAGTIAGILTFFGIANLLQGNLLWAIIDFALVYWNYTIFTNKD